MQRIERIIRGMLIIALIVSSLGLLVFSLCDENTYSAVEAKGHAISFQGVCSQDGIAFQPYVAGTPLTDTTADHTILLRGNFSEDIPASQVLMMQIAFMDITIKVNGTPIFSYDRNSAPPPFSQSGGTLMYSYQEDPILKSDQVEIRIHNDYQFNAQKRYDTFLTTLQYGTVPALYSNLLSGRYLFKFICGICLLCAGVLPLIGGCCMQHIHQLLRRRLLLFSAMAIFSGLWFIADNRLLSLFNISTIVHESFASVCSLSMWVCLVFYVRTFMTSKWCSRLLLFLGDSSLLLYCAAFFSQMLRWRYVIDFTDEFILMVSLSLLAVGVSSFYEAFKLKNREAAILLVTLIPVMVVAVIDGMYTIRAPGLVYIRENMTYCGLLLFVLANMFYMILAIDRFVKTLRKTQALERKYTQAKITIMMSQIQPHFLYNVLTIIRSLCRDDAPKAVEAVTNFSCYLRGNMDSLSSENVIPFKQELKHVKHYLSLEKIRFEERLHVVFATHTTDFCIPALTLQPLVENAVRHGIMQREEGGVIFIGTVEYEDKVEIIVEDNGVGFDTGTLRDDDEAHIGISNTRKRLELICQGTLTVYSCPGKGTKVTICLPKEDNHEYHCC